MQRCGTQRPTGFVNSSRCCPIRGRCSAQLGSADPVVRGAVIYVLSARRVGDGTHYRNALSDNDHRVRIEAVRALVSVDDVAGVTAAAGDPDREVRIAAANGLGTLGFGAAAVRHLLVDRDPLVRAAALTALGSVGCDDSDIDAVRARACAGRPGRSGRARYGHWPARPPRRRCRHWRRR